ncbi:hypothetical protein [Actinomadura madurae]|uniref:hypothetical protein n=1 Tax=Actinomadura madurae TaxID=1993 RepID=UPI0020D249D8|nr:hypothetical protein [Actinomadura madurae]MCQ0010768.1 hypothetical protein [Actinomadura madurae]
MPGVRVPSKHYPWVALSNTTLGMLLATVNSSIVIISLPAIFRGIDLNPLEPGNVSYLLWILMGYMLVSAVLVVTLGGSGTCSAASGCTTPGSRCSRSGRSCWPWTRSTGAPGRSGSSAGGSSRGSAARC